VIRSSRVPAPLAVIEHSDVIRQLPLGLAVLAVFLFSRELDDNFR
jgi:hypothetical protein